MQMYEERLEKSFLHCRAEMEGHWKTVGLKRGRRFSGSSQVFLFLPSAIISCSYSSSRLPNHPSKSMPHGSWIPAFPATAGPDTINATPIISQPSRAAPNPTETAWMTFNQPQILLFFYIDNYEVSHAIRIMGIHCNRLRPFDTDFPALP